VAQLLPPVPKEPIEPDSRIWREWFNKVRNVIVGTAQGVISWASLNFDGSNITDIVTRNHNDLQTIQGGTANQYYHLTATQLTNLGTVTTVSVATSNGFAGTVATATSTPVITLSTSVTGLLKGNGTAISAATSGTDYAPATSGTSILYGNGSGGFSNVTIGTGVSFTTGTLSATGSGGDVVGPASATDNAVARFNLTTGKLIQNSGVIIDDTNNISGVLSQQFADGTAVTLAAGKMWYNATTGSWNLGMGNGNITQQVGEELFVYGKASAAITDSPLQIIYHTGVVGASGVITFAPTIVGITDSSAIVGIATESLALNDFGRATTFGTVRGITTNGTAFGETWADDDVIWYNPVTGNPTKVAPVAPYIKIQVGTVIKAGSGGSGSFHVEIIRGSTLGGTDSNVQFSGLANNNLIQYNSTLGYWTNVTPATVTGIGSVANAVTFNNGGAGAASGTTFDGSVARTISYNTIGAQVSGTYVTSVTGTAPVVSSGGTTPAISMAAATTSVNGYLTSTDWTTFNNKGSGTVTSVSGTAGRVSSTGGTTPVIDLVSGIASAGTTGSASLIPVVTIDTYGRVTSITTAANPQGTVTSVGWTGGIVSVATATTTPAFTVAGTSGGIPYFSSTSTWATSAALAASAIVIGGGAGAAPSTTTTGTGVVTALGVNTGTAGAFVVNGGALGTPSSGTVTNLTGTASININGTVGATTATTGKFTTVQAATTMGVGAATPSASGSGITFPATQSASTDANTLDDYEEGTWTPNQGSGLTVGGAFSSIGRYTKIGNMVTVWGQVTGATSIAVSAIGIITTNLPFAEQTDIGAMGIAAGFWTSVNSAIHISVGATTSVYSVQAVSGSATIAFTISYRF